MAKGNNIAAGLLLVVAGVAAVTSGGLYHQKLNDEWVEICERGARCERAEWRLITAQGHEGNWPFLAKQVVVLCRPTTPDYYNYFATGGFAFAANGAAATLAKSRGTYVAVEGANLPVLYFDADENPQAVKVVTGNPWSVIDPQYRDMGCR